MFSVILMEKGGPERRLTFDKEELTIGRISGNDIILPKGNISKRHARLVVKDDKFIVIDLKSTNGTYVNKERISAPRVVGDDDRIYIGDFVVQLLGAGALPVRAEPSTARADAPAAVVAPPAVPPPPPPAARGGRTDQAPPSSLIDVESEAATRAVSIDQIEVEARKIEAAQRGVPVEDDGAEFIDDLEVEFDVEPVDPADVDIEAVDIDVEAPEDGEIELAEDEGEHDGPPTMAFGADSGAESAPARPIAPPAPAKPEPVPAKPEPARPDPVRMELAKPEAAKAEAPRSDSVRKNVPVKEAAPVPAPVHPAPQAPAPVPPGPQARAEVRAAAPVPPAPAPSMDDQDGQFEVYVGVLSTLHDRAAGLVFNGVNLDGELSDAQWSKFEAEVGSLVATLRAAGDVPPYLDDATLTHDVLYEFTGLGPVEYFLSDDKVTRIFVNDYNQIMVTADGSTSAVWKSFSSPAALDRVVDKLATSLGFGAEHRPPVLTGELPDGTAFQVLLPPLSVTGPVLSFQRVNRQRMTMKALIDQGALSEEAADRLLEQVAERKNIAVVGQREDDRQAIVGALALFVPEDDRVLVIEARQTVALPHRNVTRLRLPTLPEESAQLFRIVPLLLGDRLVVGSVAGPDATALIELAHSGVEGVIASFYGRTVEDGLSRLARTLVSADKAPDVDAGAVMVTRALDVFVHVTRVDGSFVLTVAESEDSSAAVSRHLRTNK